MNLVLHIAKSDLRHTWPYAAVWLTALAASWWINLQILAGRTGYIDLQGADAVALAALALFTAMLFLAGPRPGPRPIRSRDLLLGKALTLGLTAVLPFALTHWATVALRGFPLQEHALELTWNAVLMVASCAAPIAALAMVLAITMRARSSASGGKSPTLVSVRNLPHIPAVLICPPFVELSQIRDSEF